MNDKNLIPFNQRTESEQRAIRSKGGKKSAQNRREKRTYRELAKTMLSARLDDEHMLNELKAFGITETDVKAYTLLGMIKASAAGSHNAFDRLMELIGEKEQNQNEAVMTKLDAVLGNIDEVMKE